jgi:hypothetical protein
VVILEAKTSLLPRVRVGVGRERRNRLRRELQWCSHSKQGDFGVVDMHVDGGHVRFVPLVIQFIIRWGQMRVKVIQGDEVLSNEGRSEKQLARRRLCDLG